MKEARRKLKEIEEAESQEGDEPKEEKLKEEKVTPEEQSKNEKDMAPLDGDEEKSSEPDLSKFSEHTKSKVKKAIKKQSKGSL